jgi:hypothetical protein
MQDPLMHLSQPFKGFLTKLNTMPNTHRCTRNPVGNTHLSLGKPAVQHSQLPRVLSRAHAT